MERWRTRNRGWRIKVEKQQPQVVFVKKKTIWIVRKYSRNSTRREASLETTERSRSSLQNVNGLVRYYKPAKFGSLNISRITTRVGNEFKILTRPCRDYFPPNSSFPAEETSQAYCYLHSKWSDELLSLVPPVQTFTAKSRLATSTGLNQPHSLHIQFVGRMFHSESFFPRTTTLWNRLPHEYSPQTVQS